MMKGFNIILALCCLYKVKSDVYMQHPRGSNNKLNEQSNNVNNNRRLYDSQNNGEGGYQVGDACVPNCLNGNNQYDPSTPGAGEGIMNYYEGSYVHVEWTNQHGCGNNPLLHCNLVVQYMCDDTPDGAGLRDGKTTQRIPNNPADPNYRTFGQHETYEYYQRCATRRRNVNLYTADQNFNQQPPDDTAIHTRQDTNNNNDRYGFECPEERDYYPYWHPSPWRDIWVCTDETFRCPYYQSQSQNVMNKGNCSNQYYNNQFDCEYNGFQWSLIGAWNVPPPECGVCPTTRNNHNGLAVGGGDAPGYTWQVPYGVHKDGTKCVLRLRYNISTYDFDGWNIDAKSNGANSPVRGNPTNDFLGFGFNVSGPLRLAVDTDQYPRTFEDRSHVFIIRKRPDEVNNWIGTNKIWNLNVMGRRGNLQQVYPAFEYDFVPRRLVVNRNDYIHVQWTGSDANQAGNAGQGRDGTDRNNLVMAPSLGKNYPVRMNPVDGSEPPVFFTNDRQKIIQMAFLNQTNCDPNTNDANSPLNCKLLNAAPGYMNFGLVKVDNVGTFYIMNTRNNRFTNREQKSAIVVEEDWATVGAASAVSIASIGALSGLLILGFRHAKRNPESKLNIVFRANKAVYVPEFDEEENETAVPIAEKKSWAERFTIIARLQEWYEWESQRALFIGLFLLANVGFWIYGYASNLGKHPAPYFPYAKGFGKMLDLLCSFILLPVLRNFLSFLRTTPAVNVIPLDDNLKIHRLTAYLIIFATAGHVTMHYLNFVFMNNFYGIATLTNALGTVPGATGHLVIFLMMIMYGTALIKRKIFRIFGRRYDGYRVFMYFHKLYVPVYILLLLHSQAFWMFALYPLLFLVLEKFIQTRRARLDVKVVEVKLAGKDVLNIKMRLSGKQRKFRYKAGQYLFLNCAELSEHEWHPFTITSAPEDDYFSVHIRCRSDMDWTYRLRQRFGFADRTDENGKTVLASNKVINETTNQDLAPGLKVDGPYGSASEEVFDFDTVVLCGAGIGVTPFISILRSLSIRMKSKTTQEIQNMSIYFYWVCRDAQEFNSFKDLFEELVANAEMQGRVELNMYITGEMDLKKVRQEKYNQFSGKPNWNRIFKEKAQKHEGEDIGVFLCGPNAIAKELSRACKLNSKGTRKTALENIPANKRTLFKFHKENF